MPLPPPPALALTSSGKPIASARAQRVAGSPSAAAGSTARRPPPSGRGPRSWSPWRRSPPATGRSTSARRRAPPARRRRSRPGSRSRDGPRRRRRGRAACDDRVAVAGRTSAGRRRARPRRRPRARTARPRRPRSTRRRWRCPSRRQVREDAAGDLAAVGDEDALHHIRKTPKPSAPLTSALWTTLSAKPSTVRVSRGSMMRVVVAAAGAVGQRRLLGLDLRLDRLAHRRAAAPRRRPSPRASADARATMSSTPASCCGPITRGLRVRPREHEARVVAAAATSRSSPAP